MLFLNQRQHLSYEGESISKIYTHHINGKWHWKLSLLGDGIKVNHIHCLIFIFLLLFLPFCAGNNSTNSDCINQICENNKTCFQISSSTNGTSLSELLNICKSCSKTGNFSQNSLMLNKKIIEKMHFDFCSDIHPIFALAKIQKTYNLSFPLCSSSNMVNVASTIDCVDINTLLSRDDFSKLYYQGFSEVISRTEYCTDQSGKHNRTCIECKVS